MKNFRVVFFKVEKELDEKGNILSKSYSTLGSIQIDDSNVDNSELTLVSKAYRHAPNFINADMVKITEVKQ